MLITANIAFSNYLESGSTQNHPSWDDLFQFWPNQSTIDDAMQRATLEVRKSTLPIKDTKYHGLDSDEEFWNDVMKESALATMNVNDEVTTSASEESGEDADAEAEDEIFPAATANLRWQLAAGRHGRLHLLDGMCLACSRTLRRPEEGVGLSQALGTGRVWSPRCWATLSPAAQQWWASADQTGS